MTDDNDPWGKRDDASTEEKEEFQLTAMFGGMMIFCCIFWAIVLTCTYNFGYENGYEEASQVVTTIEERDYNCSWKHEYSPKDK